MKRMRKWTAFLLVLVLIFSNLSSVIAADVEVTVGKTKNVVQVGDTREYEIEYQVDVSYTQGEETVGAVLVLDRSNSMLYLDKNGDPIAKTVWDAANDFVDKFYELYPTGSLAVVSFGSNANKSDNWKTVGSKQDALNEIEEVYAYERANSKSKYKDFQRYSYKWAWKNWQLMNGGTNIASGFEYADKLLNMPNGPGGNNTVILFTDGVATRGGKNYDKDTTPYNSHNTNTKAAYEAGRALQDTADVVTVGYFDGIEKSSTKARAEETLDWAQNAGFYNAGGLGDISKIFNTIAEAIDYVGTEGTITDEINGEFELVDGSVYPEAAIEYVDGKTRITWDLGTINENSYKVGYKVKAKDSVYQSGTGNVEVPINNGAEFKFNNLNKVEEVYDLGRHNVAIPSLFNSPEVQVSVSYKDNKTDYLVGDIIEATHTLELVNQADFDYVQIDVDKLDKILDSTIEEAFELTSRVDNALWSIVDTTATVEVDESTSAASPAALSWSASKVLELKAIAAGEYVFNHDVDYSMTNGFGVTDVMNSTMTDESPLRVRESSVTISLKDDSNIGISGVNVTSGEVAVETDANGNATITGLTSGEHEIRFPLPSGYSLDSVDEDDLPAGAVIDGDEIVITVNLDYANAVQNYNFTMESFGIAGLSVTTLDGSHAIEVSSKDEVVSGKVEIELEHKFKYISFELVDDYEDGEFTFTVSSVEDGSGNIIDDVTVSDNRITFPKINRFNWKPDTYTIYGTFTPPDNFGDDGLDYEIDVKTIDTKHKWYSSTETNRIGADGLTVSLPFVEVNDEIAPTIDVTMTNDSNPTSLIEYLVTVADDIQIEEYKVGIGTLTLEEMQALVNSAHDPDEVTTDTDTEVVFSYDMPMSNDSSELLYDGAFTVYVRDAAGNETVETFKYMHVEELDVDIL